MRQTWGSQLHFRTVISQYRLIPSPNTHTHTQGHTLPNISFSYQSEEMILGGVSLNSAEVCVFPLRSRTKTHHDRISLAGLSQLPSVPQIAKVSLTRHGS